MSNRDIDVLKNELLKNRIELSDTISQFMEKCNNNFTAIVEWGGGPAGTKGDNGDPGAPTKPKVPIHVWREGIEYTTELEPTTGEFEIVSWHEDLRNVKYQDGHLIMLKNGHVYILETDNFELKPKFILALKTYDPGDVIDGRNAYVHFAYTNDIESFDDFITDQQIRGDVGETDPVEAIATFGLGRAISTGSNATTSVGEKMYMGVYSDNIEGSATTPDRYTWIRVQGAAGERGVDGLKGEKGDPGEKGEPGEKGDKGDGYTGHPYVIDLEGDMATISIDVDRTRLYDASGDYCECVVHAYYGDKNVKVRATEITIKLPNEFEYSDNDNIVLASDKSKYVGNFVKSERNNDVVIKFIPHESFEFPKQTMLFTIHVTTSIKDEDDGNTYNFERDTVWMVKGIVSTFELEILPQYRSIKLFDDGKYYPEYLKATVYKVEDAKRTVFNITENENTRFTLLYKNYDSNDWLNYNDLIDKDEDGNIIGVPTNDMSCIEFKVVKDYGIPNEEEIWDYEDVWVVSDGKSVHYYHADLGGMESMMVLTTGEYFVLDGDSDSNPDDPYAKYCAELRNESGYTVMLEPKFYDGTEELTVTAVNLRSTSSDIYVYNHTFVREVGELITEEVDGVVTYKCPFSVTRVPFGVDVLPVIFDVRATRTKEDGTTEDVNDTIGFNIYISSLKNIYTLMPSVSSFNTSTGKDGETVGCSVFKNDTIIPTSDLDLNGLTLQYIVHDGGTEPKEAINYTEPLVYGDDSDVVEDEFNAEDVAIVFILSYNGNEVVRSTVPLIKDGIDGRDGDTWQYIFCRSPRYPFSETGISDPSTWKWQHEENPDSEYLGESEKDEVTGESTYPTDVNLRWYDDHQGIDAKFRYEYQSYRKWDKVNKRWGTYGSPTLYSNYSESGSGYSVLLSNPISVIPVGSDWATDENQSNQFDSTFVYLYNNTSDISTSENVTLSLPTKEDANEYDKIDHFSIKRDETTNTWMVTFTPVVKEIAFNFESNTQYKLPITVTYELVGNSDSDGDMDGDGTPDYFTSTINWTLSPIKGLDDVEVFVDKRVVNVSTTPKHTIRVGYYSISSNGGKCFVGSHEDDKNKITDSEGNVTYKYEIILTEDINVEPEDLKKGIVDDWSSTEYNFTHQNNDGSISTKNCYVVLAEVTNESVTIIDYINITSVQDGASAMHLELTQDYIAIPCNKDGKIHEKFGDDKDETVMSQMILYNGDTEIKNDYIKYSFEINGDTLYVDGGYIYIADSDSDIDEPIGTIGKDENNFGSFAFNINYLRNIIEGDTIIKCIATYAGTSYSKTLIIDLEETPYELELNKNVLSRNVNKKEISDSELVVYVKYWKDGTWVYVNNDILVVWANGIEGYTQFDNIDGKYKIDFTDNRFNKLKTNTEAIEFRISLYKNNPDEEIDKNTKELSYETIGIIDGGKDGEDGDGWQYIFCKSPNYPFETTIAEIKNPHYWYDEDAAKQLTDSNAEYIPEDQQKYWTDDHQGVDSVNRYEYQSFRKWNKVDKHWTQYSNPTLYSNYSESGSGYSALLSNPIAIIPVGDNDWSVDEGNTNQADSTYVYFYDNVNDISKSIVVSIPEYSLEANNDKRYRHFKVVEEQIGEDTIKKIVFTPRLNSGEAFDFESNTQYKLPITINYSTKNAEGKDVEFSTKIDWTLTPIKGLSDVEVFVDKRVVNVSEVEDHTFRVGYYTISTSGGKKFIESRNNGGNLYNIILRNSESGLTPGAKLENISDNDKLTDWSNVKYDFVDANGININCYIVLIDNENTIIDYTYITSIKDGEDGSSAMHLELTQDYISVPCDKDGNIHEKYVESVSSQMILYNGDIQITDGIIYSFEINDETYVPDGKNIAVKSTGELTITNTALRNMVKGDTNIKCIATYNKSVFSKTLIIDLEETPYELEIEKNTLSRDVNVGKIIDTDLYVRVKYWKDGSWCYVNDGVLIATVNSITNGYYKFNNINDKYKLIIENTPDIENIPPLATNTIDKEVRISYYAASDVRFEKELSFETIGIINGGKDGTDGDGWQYIFCKSPLYPFGNTRISNPANWYNESNKTHNDPNVEFIPNDQKEVWFDDHQGVDSTNKYEYQSFRRWNKVDKCWSPYSNPTLYSNYSESGSGYSVLLSNPVAIIPVGDDDWSVDESLNSTDQNQSDSTFIYFYDNVRDISKSITVELPKNSNDNYSEIDHFECIHDETTEYLWKVIFNPTVKDKKGTDIAFDFGANTQYKLPITIKYKTQNAEGQTIEFSTTTSWTLTPIKGLSDIEVFADKRVVNVSASDTHTFRVGYYLTSTNGGKTFIESSDDGGSKYNIVLTSEGNNLIPGETISNYKTVTDWSNVEYDFVDNSGININCYVVLVDNSYTIIDYTTVTSIKDGADGADGVSAIHLELTQDYIAVPAKANGNGLHQNFINDENSKIQSQMILYNGDVEITKDISYSFLIDGDDASPYIIENNNGTFTVDKRKITGDTNIECVATYTPTKASFYKTLFIDVESTPYELEIDKNTLSRKVVSVDENGNIEDGYIVDSSINVKVKYWKNGSWCYVTDGNVYVKYSTKNSITGEITTGSKPFDTPSNNTYTLEITDDNIKKNIIDLEVKIVYMEGGDTLSYENIGIINNGLDGADGASAMHLELTRDNIELPASANGNSVHESYTSGMPISRMILYDGKTPIKSDVTYSFSDGDSDSENDYITIDDIGDIKIIKENIKNDLDIECIATYYGISYSKILHIKLRETPYKLEIDKKVLTRNLTKNSNDTITGEIVEETITAKVKYWMNGQWKSVTSVEGNDGVVAVTNTNSDVSYKFNHINGDDKYTLTIDNSNLKNDKNFTEIKILYIENNNEITFETIGVVNNGLSGDKGDSGSAPYCTEVEILGYSLKQDASINNESDWADSINKLGSPEPGKAIYILNKYTWSDGNTTKGITVTLAGTQGDNGKSRVLFYLGSFKTSSLTLNGSYVIGKLNDERCDYYIDVNGQAWMRIGSAEEIPGYKDGRQNNSSFWKPAETVGFLQAGAITADMINVKNLVASDVFVNNLKVTDANISGKLTAEKIDATNLTVDAANIIGTLTIGSGSENEGISLNGTLSSDNIGDGVITATKIQDGAIITGKIAANAITAGNIQAGAITAGKIAANAINANNIQAGAITAGKIQAGAITADKIQAGAITADKIAAGAITADKIDTSELSAAQINTTPKSSDAIGRISILNNDIKVYSNSEEKIVLQITGDAFGDMSGIPSVTNGSLNISAYDTGSCIVFADTRRTAKIGTFTVPNTGYNYKLNLTKNLSGTVIITSKVRSGTYTGVYSAHADLYVVKKGSNCPEFTGSCGAWFTPLTITGSTTDTEITKSTTAGLYTTSTLAAGEYDLYIRHTLKTWEPWKNNTGNSNILCKVEYSSQTLTFTLTPDVNDVQESLTCIASNGLRFVKSATEYFELNGNGDLTYKCNSGKYVFTINNSGLRMKCGDTDTPQLAISHTGIEICQKTSSGKTNGLKLDSLGYYMYIDGVKYKATRNSSGYIVLTTT